MHPTHWKLTFDGETVSMSPSVGNWSFLCQSHYWIKNDRVEWAKQWNKERIEGGRAGDRLRRERYLQSSSEPQGVTAAEAVEPQGRVAKLLRRLHLSR